MKKLISLIFFVAYGCSTTPQVREPAQVSLPELPQRIISDFDDTIKISNSPNKFETVLRSLFSKKVYPGMLELYDELLQGNKIENPKLVVISASPTLLKKKIHKTLDRAGYPPRILILRHWGKNESKFDYKLNSIRQELTLPTLLFGDDGEIDPEIYEAASSEFPDKIVGIYVRAIKGRSIPKGQSAFWTAFDVAYGEYLTGRVSESGALRVSQAVLKHEKKFKEVIPNFASCPDRYPFTCQESSSQELNQACSQVRYQVEKLCAARPRSP